jgi:CRP-like cAMP-binding protein
MGKFVTLDACQMLQDWSLDERSALAHFLEHRSYDANATLIDRSSKASELLFIASGKVKLSAETYSIEILQGATIGELSLMNPTQKRISAIAITPVDAYVLSSQRWLEMKRNTPSVAVRLMESILKKVSNELGSFELPPKSQWAKSASAL